MFSTSEYEYIKALTEQEYSNGNKYYLCVTNNPINQTGSNNIYDVICYYSKEKITENNTIITIPNNSRKCSLDSNNYSTQNTIDKIECVNYNGNINKNKKEYIYSNVGEYANIIKEYEEQYNYNYNLFVVGLILVSLIIIYKVIKDIVK